MDTNTPRDNPEIDSLEWRFKRLCPNTLAWPAEIERLRAENTLLREALITVGRGKFGAKRIPADTGDIFLALSSFVRKALETAQNGQPVRKQDVDVCE